MEDVVILVIVVVGAVGGLALMLRWVARSQRLAEVVESADQEESGLVEQRRQRRIEAAQKMSPEQRKKSALEDLRQARTQLIAIEGMLVSTGDTIREAIRRAKPDGFDDAGREFSSLVHELNEARALVQNAAIKLEDPALDRALPDVAGADFAVHYDLEAINRAGALHVQLRERVDRAFERHG